MKQFFWLLCASIVSILLGGSHASVVAQTATPTPDPFAVQLTSLINSNFSVVLGDMSSDGRFVVFTSNGNVSTEATSSRNNLDGNREIFLADYAQRRIFQITNTRNVPNPTPTPSPTPTPTASPSPTPTPTPTPADPTQIKIEIVNRAPMISLAPALSEGQRVYTIVFSSNAPDPANFDGTEGNLAQDANTEIWIYRLPAVPDVDLTLGADLPTIPLDTGTFTRITNSPASRLPTAGSATASPFFADDNREVAISDDGRIIAFISTRNVVANTNTDGNPELFLHNLTNGAFAQVTTTQDATPGVGFTFQTNPSLSANGSVVAFSSSANLASNNADGNAEIFMANFDGVSVSNIRQVTRTQNSVANTNVLSPGRRLSRDGGFIAFESRATDPKSNAVATGQFLGTFVYTVATDTFVEIGPRPTVLADITHFPLFTDYNASLTPGSVVFASALNFRPDGTFPSQAQDAEGLNPQRGGQLFLTSLPAGTSQNFVRLTRNPAFAGILPVTSDTRRRAAFIIGGQELGGGNSDGSVELFYLLSPQATVQSGATLSFFTGASDMPVAAATPVPSPTPTPTPTPSPVPGSPPGLAPGELSFVRSTIALAPSNALGCPISPSTCGSETRRSPALPVELNGVSVSVNGHAAGLYFVGNAEKQINFVVPIGTAAGLATVVVNIRDAAVPSETQLRGLVQIVPGQPDIFSTTTGANGRTLARNADTLAPEPFSVTTNGNPTRIELPVTGVRFAARTEISVTVGTTVITGDGIISVGPSRESHGFDTIVFVLPASLAGAGDVPIQVSFTRGGLTTTSRPATTAPGITIN